MKNTHILLALTALSLGACAALSGSGAGAVQSIGKDSYTVRILSEKSVSDAKMKALSQANSYCNQNAKRNVQLVQEQSGTEEDGSKFYDITFYCLPQGDADFIRYRPQGNAEPVTK